MIKKDKKEFKGKDIVAGELCEPYISAEEYGIALSNKKKALLNDFIKKHKEKEADKDE